MFSLTTVVEPVPWIVWSVKDWSMVTIDKSHHGNTVLDVQVDFCHHGNKEIMLLCEAFEYILEWTKV